MRIGLRTAWLFLALAAGPPAPAQEPDGQSAAARYFGDAVLVDQNGQAVRFYSDLMQGKVVVINSFFASCEGSCPLMAQTFAKIQEWLGERLGNEVNLISISVDPANDTPEKLHAYAERFKARPGWRLLTGEPENVKYVLSKIGQYVENREGHSNLIIIGNEPTGLWKKVLGLAPAEEVIRVVDSVLSDIGPDQ